MCIIIQRDAGFEIPYEKFKTAVLNNPHGYGLSFPDDKGLSVFRNPEEPDPEALYRIINEELIDKNLLIHLRWTTVGATNMRNAHPFSVLERKTDGIDLRMAHNGTLHQWSQRADTDESDTRSFVRGYVRPLFKRLIKGMDSVDILNDDFCKKLLEDQLSSASVLSFLDGEGNTLICNPEGNGGKQDEGWYYSNTYSFNPDHRSKKKYTTGGGTTSTGKTTKTTGNVTYLPSGGTRSIDTQTSTRRFTDRFKLKSIKAVKDFSDDTINRIVADKDVAALLIKELIEEVSIQDAVAARLYRENEKLKEVK